MLTHTTATRPAPIDGLVETAGIVENRLRAVNLPARAGLARR